jgi:hypothetical protein
MKADVAKQDTESDEAQAAGPPRPPRSGELPLANEEPAAEDGEDVFEEVPTVANRALPTPDGEPTEWSPSSHETAGSYRLVRPTVSDFVAQPVATKIEPAAAKGVVIGQARKPR